VELISGYFVWLDQSALILPRARSEKFLEVVSKMKAEFISEVAVVLCNNVTKIHHG
jgi:hypothetical protein